MVLLTISVGIVCFSMFIYNNNTIEEPIIIPQNESILSIEGSNAQHLKIAYLDNRHKHKDLLSISIGERTFFTIDSNPSIFDYTYYSLYEATFIVTGDDVAYFKESPDYLENVTFQFSQQAPQIASLAFLEPFDQSNFIPVRTTTTNGKGTLTFDVKDEAPITISTIKSTLPFVTFTATVDDKPVNLPITLDEDSVLEINMRNLYNFTTFSLLQLQIAGYDHEGLPFLRKQILDSNGHPPEKIMRQFVKEWRDSK